MPKLIKDKKTILKTFPKLKKLGLTNKEIADIYDIDVKTLYNIRHTKYEELDDGINRVSFMHKLSEEVIKFVIDNTVNNCYFKVHTLIKLVHKKHEIKLTPKQIYIILEKNEINCKRVGYRKK